MKDTFSPRKTWRRIFAEVGSLRSCKKVSRPSSSHKTVSKGSIGSHLRKVTQLNLTGSYKCKIPNRDSVA